MTVHDESAKRQLTGFITLAVWSSIALVLGGLAFGRYSLLAAGLILFAVAALWRPVRPELDERGPPL